jgi:hypothetical protein
MRLRLLRNGLALLSPEPDDEYRQGRRSLVDRPGDLEYHADAGRIVVRAGAVLRVVVSADEQVRRVLVESGRDPDDVPRLSALRKRETAAFGAPAECLDPRLDIRRRAIVTL